MNNRQHNKIVQLEGTYKDHLFQLPERIKANQKVRHIIKGINQMPLEHWQSRGMQGHDLAQKPVSGFDHPHGQEIFPDTQPEPPQHSFVPFPCVLLLVNREKKLAPPGDDVSDFLFFIFFFLS